MAFESAAPPRLERSDAADRIGHPASPSPVPMIEVPQSKASAAREQQTAKKDLASTLRPLRLLVAASIILPIAIFLFAAWISYHQHLAEARDRVQRNLNTIYEHALKVFETFDL